LPSKRLLPRYFLYSTVNDAAGKQARNAFNVPVGVHAGRLLRQFPWKRTADSSVEVALVDTPVDSLRNKYKLERLS